MGLVDKLSKFEQDPPPPPPLSGAYIRSLVKQLANSSSRPKDTTTTTMNTNNDTGCVVDSTSVSPSRSSGKHGNKVLGAQPTQQQQQHKKQARRRLHTSRPYQERLLNMAEARREIVTALKFHRAAMKQASEQKQQQQQQVQEQKQQQQHQPSESFQLFHHRNFEQDGKFNNSRWNSRTLPSCMNNFPNNILDEFPYSSSFSHNIPLSSSVPNPYNLPVANSSSPIIAPPLVAENPNFTLPNQALGLNLNLHDFINLDDATLFLNNNNNNNNNNYSPLFSYSSPTSSSPPLSVVTDQEVLSIGTSQGEGGSSIMVDTIESMATTNHVSGGGLHTAMDDEGMEEIRSLGEQYQMEWNDTMNLVTSTWWFNFLMNMEHGTAPEVKTEVDAYHNFDELMEFPAWLNPNESCLEQCSKDYFKDPTLPCMDIEDIEFEGMDEEWLS